MNSSKINNSSFSHETEIRVPLHASNKQITEPMKTIPNELPREVQVFNDYSGGFQLTYWRKQIVWPIHKCRQYKIYPTTIAYPACRCIFQVRYIVTK